MEGAAPFLLLAAFAEGQKDFFAKVADIQITLVAEGAGNAAAIVLHQQGVSTPANRIE